MTWPWPDLDLTWSQTLKLTFQGEKAHVWNRLDEANTMVPFLFSCLSCHKKLSWWKQHLHEKKIIFHLMTSGAIAVVRRSNPIKKRYWSMKRAVRFFIFFLVIILLELKRLFAKKSLFSLRLDLWWPLVTSILTWFENNLCKILRSHRGLSNAFCWLSLNSVVFLDTRGVSEAPPRHKLHL